VEVGLPFNTCTLDQILDALARVEPRIASYLRGGDGLPSASFRALLGDQLLQAAEHIPNGGVVTLLYAVAGGSEPSASGPASRQPTPAGGHGDVRRR